MHRNLKYFFEKMPFNNYNYLKYIIKYSSYSILPTILILIITITVSAYYLLMYYISDNSAQETMARWGQVGDFVGALLQTIVASTAILAAVIFSTLYQYKSNSQREAVKLSEMMYNRDFYISVAAPSWEIATKWRHWEGEKGAEYRCSIVAGEFIELRKNIKFHTPEAANGREFSNHTRFIDHYKPYCMADEPEITSLSEHMVLVTWLRFWNHVHFLIKNYLVDEQSISTLLRDWYASWYPFMYQYRKVGELILANANSESPDIKLEHVKYSIIFTHLADLEKIFSLSPKQEYNEYANKVFNEILSRYKIIYSDF